MRVFLGRVSAVLVAAAVASWGFAAPAQTLTAAPNWTTGWYVGGEAGWTDLGSEEAHLPPKEDGEVWSNGFAIGARVGYQFGPVRVEEEFRYGSNDLDRIGLHPSQGARDAYAFMTNALYDINLGWPVSPHIGAGVGAVGLHDGARVAALGIPSFDNSTDWVFGYQGIAGLSYAITPALTADLDYRYLSTTMPRFTTSPGLVIDGVFQGDKQVSSGYSIHTILGSLVWHFGE